MPGKWMALLQESRGKCLQLEVISYLVWEKNDAQALLRAYILSNAKEQQNRLMRPKIRSSARLKFDGPPKSKH